MAKQENKSCCKCKIIKSLVAFDNHRGTFDGKHGTCKSCRSIYGKSERGKKQRRDYQATSKYKSIELLQKYGISFEEKQKLFHLQNGKCFLCPFKFKSVGKAQVDHCHNTNKVRKLLCGPCNRLLGHYEKNLHRFTQFDSYIKGIYG